jgi:hypothetical protein
MQPTTIDSPLGWKLLARQEFAIILLTFWTPSVWSYHAVSMKALTPAEQKNVRDTIEQEYLAYLFINNSNQKLHSQLKKDVTNNY